MGHVSQAFKRSGVIAATPREGDASASSNSIFNAYAPEVGGQTTARPETPSLVARPIGRSGLTAVPTPSHAATSSRPQWSPTPVTTTAPAPAASTTSEAAPSTATVDADADRLIDTEQIGNYIGFIFRSLGRHWLLAATTALLMMGATSAAALYWPKSYHVDAKLLVQRNEVMASLVNPGRTISREAEAPTRAAEEIVLQHDNLLSLIKQTDLMTEWERTRIPLLKTKDRIFAKLRGPQTEESRLESMVGLLEQRLKVYATPEGSVTFDIAWPDPQMAYSIVDHSIQNFLQFRRVSETSAIADSIAILDQSVASLETTVTQTISELPKRRTTPTVRRSEPAPAAAAAPAVPVITVPAGPPPDLVRRRDRLKADLDIRRQNVARLDEAHRAQLNDAQSRLAAAKMVYAEDFPTVIALRQSVAQLSRESAELVAARRDAQNAESEYETLNSTLQAADDSARTSATAASTALTPSTPRVRIDSTPIEVDLNSGESNDPTSLRLKVELAELATVRERANAARAELSSSQAGFKYQYTVLRPPQVPRGPSSPNVPAFLAAGVVASLLLALMAAIAADLVGGKVLEPWQVERQLGLPVALTLHER